MDDPELAERMSVFRNHGITTDHRQREARGEWFYAMEFLGYNYRITDFQCTLGLSQLQKLPEFLHRRHEIAAQYEQALAEIPGIEPFGLRSDVLPAFQSAERRVQSERKVGVISDSTPYTVLHTPCSLHAYHLYVIRCGRTDRDKVFKVLRQNCIGVNVHYVPVHLHPYYQKNLNTGRGLCPVAENAYEEIISLPLFPRMTDEDVAKVIDGVKMAIKSSRDGRI